jgi:molecular chaperone GrpE
MIEGMKSSLADDGGAAAPPTVAEALTALSSWLQSVDARLANITPMLQFMAKAAERSDRARDQQMLELRAHLTSETDRLAAGLRADTARRAAVDVLEVLLPALDEFDDVLRVHGGRTDLPGIGAMAIVRHRLRDAFARLGIEESATVARGTPFDPELHDPVPGQAAADLPPSSVIALVRVGYRAGNRLIRAPRVTVTP